MIPVTKPYLPPREEYDVFLNGVWSRNWLTNNGPLVNELEIQLKRYLGIKHLLYLGNGTIALQIAIRALGLKGKIITTPFSYVATTSSIVWENCEPVFVDIDRHSLNIDSTKIEEEVTEDVVAILATHCFGNSCDIKSIETIAKRHGIKVIYDAAHCFGTKYQKSSIFEFGDVSITSFHATKLFHTIEGGAVITKDPDLLRKMAYMRNFGHDGPEKFNGVGINGKNSEFHAAMGLCNLKYIDELLQKRKEQCQFYDEILKPFKVGYPLKNIYDDCEPNYAYYPVIFQSEKVALTMKQSLEKWDIYPRRYFYPPLSKLAYVKPGKTPISDDISKRILCLPLYHGLSQEEQLIIARILLRTQNYEL